MMLVRYFPRTTVTAIAVLLLSSGLLNAVLNRHRSLVPTGDTLNVYEPRLKMYFAYGNDRMASSYIASAEAVTKSGCANVGIDSYTPFSTAQMLTSPDSFFIYPILALLRVDGGTRKAWYEGVHNMSARYSAHQPHPPPCAIICLDCAKVAAKWAQYGCFPYHTVFENAVVFTAANNPHH